MIDRIFLLHTKNFKLYLMPDGKLQWFETYNNTDMGEFSFSDNWLNHQSYEVRTKIREILEIL